MSVVANRTSCTQGRPCWQVLSTPPSVLVGAVRRRQCVPPSVVPSSLAHRPVPQPTEPRANPVSSETNVIDTTRNPAGALGALGDGEVTGVVAADDVVWPGEEPAGLAAEPQAASDTIAMAAAAEARSRRAVFAPRRRADRR